VPCCRKPELQYTPNEFNSAVLDRCPTMQSTYECTPFLTNGHAETILVAKLRKPPGVVYKREILVTKDGGAVAVDWEHIDDEGKVSNRLLGHQAKGGDWPVLRQRIKGRQAKEGRQCSSCSST
jgi:predicted alpha/beta-fold hydrolase